MSDAFEKVLYHGRLMDRKTMAFVQAMEAKLGYELTIVQGSYNAGTVSQSAGTHDGGGVVDLTAYDYRNKVKVAADLGAFVWYRPYLPGHWGAHIHLGIRNHGRLADSAARQQNDWDARPPRNGLASHAVMTHEYHPGKEIGFKYPVREKPAMPTATKVTKARDKIVSAIHDLADAASLLDNTDPGRVKAKAQVDEIKAARRDLKAALKALPKE